MQARVDWVLMIFGTQVIKKKRPFRPVFPDYLSVSYDYDEIQFQGHFMKHEIFSCNTLTLVPNIHCVCFSLIKNCVNIEKTLCKI